MFLAVQILFDRETFMNFIHDLPSQINRMVVKNHILSKIMQKLKINKGMKHEMDSMRSCSTDDKTSKNRLEVQIIKNAGGRIRTCEGTKPIAFTTTSAASLRLRLSPLTAREPPLKENLARALF